MNKKLIAVMLLVMLVSSLATACAPAAPPAPTPTAAPKTAATAPATKASPTQAPATPTPKPESLKMAAPTTGLVELAQQIADKKGFFKEENLEVEITAIKSDVALKAMVAGELDFIFSLGTTLRAAAQGVPVKAVLGAIVKPYHVIVVRPEIQEGKDLKGKVMAVDSIGGTTEYLMRKALEHYKLDPDKDATMTALGGNPTRMAALKSGAAVASALESMYAYKAEDEGMKLLLPMSDIIEMPVAGLGASDKMIKERPDLVLRVVRATVKGLRFIKDPKNKDEVINFMVAQFKVDPAVAVKTYPDIQAAFSIDGFLTDKAVMQDVNLAKERLKITKDIPVSQAWDPTFVQKVKAGN